MIVFFVLFLFLQENILVTIKEHCGKICNFAKIGYYGP